MIIIYSIIIIFVITSLLTALTVAGNIFYNIAVRRGKKSFLNRDKRMESEEYRIREEQNQAWYEEHQPETVKQESFDRLILNGYLFRQPEEVEKWVVIIHGYNGKALDMLSYIKEFYHMGYNILAPDCRGHGDSEGKYMGMGWHDRKDVMSWINYILTPNAEIVLFGKSMGGATVMMTSGEDLPSQIQCIIEDCGYTSVWEQFKHQTKQLYKIPAFPVLYAGDIICQLRAGYNFKKASAVRQLAKAKKPILFIHGTRDTFVPLAMVIKVYESAKCKKELLLIENAGHGEAERVNASLYYSTIQRFIQSCVPVNH